MEINPLSDKTACSDCTYYIAVHGFKDSVYSLVVSLFSSIVSLEDGMPQSGTVAYHQWAFFQYSANFKFDKDVKVVASSSLGSASLYITLNGSIPTISSFLYKSDDTTASTSFITIKSSDEAATTCRNSKSDNCQIKIGVYGLLYANDYTIVLNSAGTAVLLQDGVLQSNIVDRDKYAYYKYILTKQSVVYTLEISVVIYSGHASLYASCTEFPPTRNISMWKLSPAATGQSLKLSSSVINNQCKVDSLIVSMYGDTEVSFGLVVKMRTNITLTLLVAGIAVSHDIQFQDFDYYYIKPTALNNEIRLQLTISQGDADLYVSADWETRPRLTNGQVTSFIMKSSNLGSEDLFIDTDGIKKLCSARADCYLVVAVYASYSTPYNTHLISHYSLLATFQDSIIKLASGIPQSGRVDKGFAEYYSFSYTQVGVDLTIDVTALSGDPGVYMSFVEFL